MTTPQIVEDLLTRIDKLPHKNYVPLYKKVIHYLNDRGLLKFPQDCYVVGSPSYIEVYDKTKTVFSVVFADVTQVYNISFRTKQGGMCYLNIAKITGEDFKWFFMKEDLYCYRATLYEKNAYKGLLGSNISEESMEGLLDKLHTKGYLDNIGDII